MQSRALVALALCAGLWACAAEGDAPVSGRGFDGPGVQIDVAALNLVGVGDVVWDLEVDNGDGAVVWQRRVTSSTHGDSAGSASYVGPCDADPAVSENTVKVWVVGVYDGDILAADAGTFASGAATGAGAVTGTAVDFQNPTVPVTGPLTQVVTCAPNVDAAVQFDVTLMRPAQQGFFDIALNFDDIYCSAKLDCCDDADANGCTPAEDIKLLFDATGARARTLVLGFACTAGTAADVVTELYMDALELDCTAPNSGVDFAADLTLDPAGGPGNLCPAGAVTGCAAVGVNAVDADTYLYQVAVFRGEEQLTSGGVDAQKVYWNVALGVTGDIGSCRLRTRATADDSANTSDNVDGGQIAAGAVYPVVRWDADLGTCGSEKLTFGSATAAVTTVYTATGGAEEGFTYHFGPSIPAAPFVFGVVANGTGRSWYDGTYAPSCDAYLHPTAPSYAYQGLTGDGVYTIDTDGAGPYPPRDVYCDMTTDGGGWTLMASGWYPSYSVPAQYATLGAFVYPWTQTDVPPYQAMRLQCHASNGVTVYRFRTLPTAGHTNLEDISGSVTETYDPSDNVAKPSNLTYYQNYAEWHGFGGGVNRYIVRTAEPHCGQDYSTVGLGTQLGEWGRIWVR